MQGRTFDNSIVGAPVYTQDGEHLGKVKEVRGNAFKVDAPMAPDFWLRGDAIATGSSSRVTLAHGSDALDGYRVDEGSLGSGVVGSNTDHEYTTDTRRAGTAGMSSTVGAAGVSRDIDPERRSFAAETGVRSDSVETGIGMTTSRDTTETRRMTDRTDIDADRERTIELREEELRARKEAVQAGEVEVSKRVVTEQQTIDVPVTREEVVIETRDVADRPASGPIDEHGETIRVPLREEHATLEKETVVTGEVSVGKRTVQETERLTGEVRREEIEVNEEGDVDIDRGPAYGRTYEEERTRRQS